MLKFILNKCFFICLAVATSVALSLPKQSLKENLSPESIFHQLSEVKKNKRIAKWVLSYLATGKGIELPKARTRATVSAENTVYLTQINGKPVFISSVRLKGATKVTLVLNANETECIIDVYDRSPIYPSRYLISFQFVPNHPKYFLPRIKLKLEKERHRQRLSRDKERVRYFVKKILAKGYKSIDDSDKKIPSSKVKCTNTNNRNTFGNIPKKLQKKLGLKNSVIQLKSKKILKNMGLKLVFVFGLSNLYLELYSVDSNKKITRFKFDRDSPGYFKEIDKKGTIKTVRKKSISRGRSPLPTRTQMLKFKAERAMRQLAQSL